MLYGDEKYIKEFAEAAIGSFTEFKEDYSKHLLVRDETSFRKAGHKIKPVAQMLEVHVIVEEYEHAKTLLWENKSDDELQASSSKMNTILEQVLSELKEY